MTTPSFRTPLPLRRTSARGLKRAGLSVACCALAFFGLAPVVSTPVSAHAPGVRLSASGTATIDGVHSYGEWDRAALRVPPGLHFAGCRTPRSEGPATDPEPRPTTASSPSSKSLTH